MTRSVKLVLSSPSFGANDVGGASQTKLAFCKGNKLGCGRPVSLVTTILFVFNCCRLLTTCQTNHAILSHKLDDVLQRRRMPSFALRIDVMGEIQRHLDW